MNDETILKEIVEGDIHTLWNLLQMHKEEYPEIYERVKYGLKLKYHIGHELQNRKLDRSRAREIVIAGEIYSEEEDWDEIESRETEARKCLLEHYQKEEETFTGR